MAAISGFFSWLFETRTGVMTLILGGIALCCVIAFVLEIGTRAKFKNHKRSEGDWDLFGDDESGWSDFEGDNN